jgi:8-amino-7-oxononanoate synthase
MKLPHSLQEKLNLRAQKQALRSLSFHSEEIDFSSNDYLGFAKNEELFEATHKYLVANNLKINGATGSRLISGNHNLYAVTEKV